MLDLGNSFRASVERDPEALAIVDAPIRLTYAQWYRHISAAVAGFDELGLAPEMANFEQARHIVREMQFLDRLRRQIGDEETLV